MQYCFENIGPFKISYTLLKWFCDMLILMMIIEYLYVLLISHANKLNTLMLHPCILMMQNNSLWNNFRTKI